MDDDNFLEAITEQNLTFFYHPCGDTKNLPVKNVSDVDNDCKSGYTLCMFNKTENKARVLGKHDDMSFKMNGEVMQVNFITSGTTDGTRASIWLQCVPKAKISVLYAPLEKIDQVVSCRRMKKSALTKNFIISDSLAVQSLRVSRPNR